MAWLQQERVQSVVGVVPDSSDQPGRNSASGDRRILSDNITMAALSRAPSSYPVAQRCDRDSRRRRHRPILGRVAALAAGDAFGALALVGRPLGGGLVPQLASPANSRRASRAGCGKICRVVRRRFRSRSWRGSNRDHAGGLPPGALASLVARRPRLHLCRTVGASRPTVARAT